MEKALVPEVVTFCPADELALLENFLQRAQRDPRIGPVHISLYLGLWKLWRDSGIMENGIRFFSYQLLPLGKVSSCSTYHKAIKQLHAFGYICYAASYNRNKGSYAQFLITNETTWKQEKV